MANEKSSRAKPCVNVAMLGQAGHGKTTLTAAILKEQAKSNLAEAVSYDDIEDGDTASFACETQSRHYRLVDCAGVDDSIKDMVTNIEQMDGAIVVVSALDSVMPQLREQVLLSNQLGLDYLVVFLNKCDQIDDEGALDMVEMEVRELLSKHKFDGGSVPVIRGAALPALNGEAEWEPPIGKLLVALDSFIPKPVRDFDKPFLMAIEAVSASKGRDTAATGRIVRGVVQVGEEVEVVGSKGARKTVVTGLQMFGKPVDEGRAGDSVDCLLRGIGENEIECGQVLAKPGAITPRAKFTGQVYVLKREEGGRHEPFLTNYRPQFLIRSADVMGTGKLPEGVTMVMPGDNITMTIELDAPVALEEQMHFTLCDDDKVVGVGVVTNILA